MNSFPSKFALSLVMLVVCNTSYGEIKTQSLAEFTSLSTSNGIAVNISCARENKISYKTEELDGRTLNVDFSDGRLALSVEHPWYSWFNNNRTIHLDMQIAGTLKELSASSGSEIRLPECGTDKQELKVNVSSGAEVYALGTVDRLILNTSSGASFNDGQFQGFQARLAHIALSSGSDANLCGILALHGNISSGASALILNESNHQGLNQSSGGDFSKSACNEAQKKTLENDAAWLDQFDESSSHRHQWLVAGASLRGALSDNKSQNAKWGFELAAALPYWHGLDLGMNWGSMFLKDGSSEQVFFIRTFILQTQKALYLSINSLKTPSNLTQARSRALSDNSYRQKKNSYTYFGTIGWSFGPNIYSELDVMRGNSRPIKLIPEFGLRLRL